MLSRGGPREDLDLEKVRVGSLVVALLRMQRPTLPESILMSIPKKINLPIKRGGQRHTSIKSLFQPGEVSGRSTKEMNTVVTPPVRRSAPGGVAGSR